MLGWRERSFAVGGTSMPGGCHPGGGIVRATAIANGRVVGTWTARGGAVAVEPFAPLAAGVSAALRRRGGRRGALRPVASARMTARDRAAAAQPLWALVAPADRARYLRRAAMAVLDELDALADLLAAEAGHPRSEALLAELLPSVGGLHGLANDGPGALADRRLGPVPALRAGRRSTLIQVPLGVVGVHVRDDSPWAGPLLEVAAALLAGNGVLLVPAAPRAAARMRNAFVRAALPEELFQLVAEDDLAGVERVVTLDPPSAKGTMLVLEGAPLDRAITGALWAAFAGGGRRHAGLGRRDRACRRTRPRWPPGIETAARRLRVGDPSRPDTEVGPLRASPRATASRRWSRRPRPPEPRACAAARSSCPRSRARSTRRWCSATCRRTPSCCTSPCPARCSRSRRRPPRRRRSRSPARPRGRCRSGAATATTAS